MLLKLKYYDIMMRLHTRLTCDKGRGQRGEPLVYHRQAFNNLSIYIIIFKVFVTQIHNIIFLWSVKKIHRFGWFITIKLCTYLIKHARGSFLAII